MLNVGSDGTSETLHEYLRLPQAMSVDQRGREPVMLSKPSLPTLDRLAPYLSMIDKARFYTNGGALHDLLRERLARHCQVDETQLGLAGSGTVAIIGLLLGVGGRAGVERPLCVCPSYTFSATLCAAEACGYAPYLVDIDPHSWALDPATVEALPDFDRVGAVLVVAPYGRPLDLAAWRDFVHRTGRVVVIDAAAGFDSLSYEAIIASEVPVAMSLHATKTLSTAEGGLMLCADRQVMRRAAAALNFGFDTQRESVIPGMNGKISEYHAAIGLAELDGWPCKRASFVLTASIYAMRAELDALEDQVRVNTRCASPYALFVAQDAAEADAVAIEFAAQRIEWRRWYGHGLHMHPAYARYHRTALPVTMDVAHRVIGLPFSTDLPTPDIDRVVHAINCARTNMENARRRAM
jgi:dTDP-4-amino-4,6-dideoxygalactose transaminase